MRFWGQVLWNYLWGTQGIRDLCFGGFNTYRTQPSFVFYSTFRCY